MTNWTFLKYQFRQILTVYGLPFSVLFKPDYVYTARFTIKNTLEKPIVVRWDLKNNNDRTTAKSSNTGGNALKISTGSWSTTSPQSYTIQPGTTKDVLVKIRFTEPLPKNVDLKSLVTLSATLGDTKALVMLDDKEKRPLEIKSVSDGDDSSPGNSNNGNNKDLTKAVVIKPSLPSSKILTLQVPEFSLILAFLWPS